jgi:co-chaperonin GroES (HSP10)
MNFKKGDYVTRNSYQNDITFEVINTEKRYFIFKGNRMLAYMQIAPVSDCILVDKQKSNNADNFESTSKI